MGSGENPPVIIDLISIGYDLARQLLTYKLHTHTKKKQKKNLNGSMAMAVPAVAVPPAM